MSCQLDHLQPWYPSAERSRARTDCLLNSLLDQIEADRRRALSTFGLRFVDENNAAVDAEQQADGGEGDGEALFEWRPASQLPSFYSRRLRPNRAAALTSSTSAFRLSRRGVPAFRSVAALRRKPSVATRTSIMDLVVVETPKRVRQQQQQQPKRQLELEPQHKRRRHPAGQPQSEATEPTTVAASPPKKPAPPGAACSSNFASRLRQRLLQPIRRCLVGSSRGGGGSGSSSRSRSTPRLIELRPRKSTSSVQLRVTDMFKQQKKEQLPALSRGKSMRN